MKITRYISSNHEMCCNSVLCNVMVYVVIGCLGKGELLIMINYKYMTQTQ